MLYSADKFMLMPDPLVIGGVRGWPGAGRPVLGPLQAPAPRGGHAGAVAGRTLRLLAEADPVAGGRGERGRGRQHLVLGLEGSRHHVEEDARGPHGLPEHVLSSGGGGGGGWVSGMNRVQRDEA